MTKLPPARILETRLCSRLSRIFHVPHPHAGGSKCLCRGRRPGDLKQSFAPGHLPEDSFGFHS